MAFLTSEAVDVVSRVKLGEARLVAVAVDGPDPGLPAPATLPWGHDGVADAPVGQPAGTAQVQPVTPGRVQLGRGDQLGPVAQAVSPGFPEGEALGGGAMEHLAFTQADGCLCSRNTFFCKKHFWMVLGSGDLLTLLTTNLNVTVEFYLPWIFST